jgi:hypothetical protein
MGWFIGRGLAAIDAGELDAMILLLRNDHLQSENQYPPHNRMLALKRDTQRWLCHWRPIWIEGTEGNPRWCFWWIVWERGAERRPPMIIEPKDIGL